jgi:hypothetical protein
MVMEWLEGHTLDEEIAANGRLSFERAAEILRQIAAALDEAHIARIIHRDLKPSNIIIVRRPSGGDQVKVLDFGIAKVVTSTAGSAVSMAMGTPNYASPEQLTQGGNIDTRSDIYSLGVMLYQMLSGSLPFSASSIHELIRLQVFEEPPPLRDSLPDAPAGVERLLKRMMDKEPRNRPDTAGEVCEEYETCLVVGRLLVEAQKACAEKEYRLAISKWEEVLRLSPQEPGIRESVKAAQEKLEDTRVTQEVSYKDIRVTQDISHIADSRGRIDNSISEASQAFGKKPEVKLLEETERLALESDGGPFGRAVETGEKKQKRLGRQLAIGGVALVVIAIVIGAIWLQRSNDPDPTPTGAQAQNQGSPMTSSDSKASPPAAVTPKVELLTYYLETEADDGTTTRASGLETFKPDQKYKLHFTPRESGYLYIVAPGTSLDPTTYLTAKPIAATGVSTNQAAAGSDFVFPGGDNWMRVKGEVDTTEIRVIFSPEPLQTPDYLASSAGRKLTPNEYSQLEKYAARGETDQSSERSRPKVALKGEERKPIMFDIRLKRH